MRPPVETAFFAVSRCISYHFIIKKAAVQRSMRRCLIAQSRSMSKTPRPLSCAYPSSGLIAVRPPYKNTLRSQKSVPLHSTLKKCYAARSMAYIRPIVILFLKANAMSAFLVTSQAAPSPIIERRQGNAVSTGRTGRGIQQKIHPKYGQKAFFLPKQTKKSIFSRKIFVN